MATYDVGTNETFIHGNESVIIRNYLDGVKGGVVLDTEDFTDDLVRCGHVIIKESDGDNCKPMPVSDGAYGSLEDGYEYFGVCAATVPADAPLAAVMTAGEVNENAVPYSISSIKSDLIAAMPNIRWAHD